MSDQITYLRQEFDFLGSLERNLRDLQGYDTLAYELIQNADDVKDADGNPGTSRITFDITRDSLIVENDGTFRPIDFERMKQLAAAGKRDEENTTGAFGIGFTVVYQITDTPELFSSGQHWRFIPVRPENNIEVRPAKTNGTVFRLPFAVDPDSETRRRLKQQVFDVANIDGFVATLCEAVSFAALFLKQLQILEVKRDGRLVLRIERSVREGSVYLNENGQSSVWRLLDGNFEGVAQELRSQFPFIEAKRRSYITLALRQEVLPDGRLFAVLPTNSVIGLPFHLNADFFPKSDRKQIIFDDGGYQSDWNRAAVLAAAEILVSNFDVLREHFGPQGFWEFLYQLSEVGRNSQNGGLDPVFSHLWERVFDGLAEQKIIFTSKSEWVEPIAIRLLQTDEEINAIDIFEAIGLPVVHPDLRKYQNLFLRFGVKRLTIEECSIGLQEAGFDRQTSLNNALAPLNSLEAWGRLWSALDRMLSKSSPDKRAADEDLLRKCAVFLDSNERILPASDLYKGSSHEAGLFNWLSWQIVDGQGSASDFPYRLVEPLTLYTAAMKIQSRQDLEERWKAGSFDLVALYNWLQRHLEERHKYKNQGIDELLDDLAIFPVNGKLQSLSAGLYVATDFIDPLGAANLIDLAALGHRRDLLFDLQVPELTFESYVRDEVPNFFDTVVLDDEDQHWKLLTLLADRLGSLRNSPDLKQVLSELPLITCQDDSFQLPDAAYLDPAIRDLLGDDVLIASTPPSDAIRELYKWLGVADQPRTEDLVERLIACPLLESDLSGRVELVTRIVRILGERELYDFQLTRLKSAAWLPARQNAQQLHGRWYRPDQLFAAYQAYLFERSDALILNLDTTTQAKTAELLRTLGVKQAPTAELVVQHLIAGAKSGESVNTSLYQFLNDKLTPGASGSWLTQLRGIACLWLGDRYATPKEVFWDEHPFGTYRYRLDREKWATCQRLLGELGVREKPELVDFRNVLREVASEFSGVPAPDDIRDLIYRCLDVLSQTLNDNPVSASSVRNCLHDLPVLPNGEGFLNLPSQLVFEDRPEIKTKFDSEIAVNIIPRKEGVWPAMQAAGVRFLSDVLSVVIINAGTSASDERFTEIVRDRTPLLKRVVDSQLEDDQHEFLTDFMECLDVRRTSDLTIQYNIPVFNGAISSPEPSKAVWLENEHTLYYVAEDQGVHIHLARELALALLPSTNITPWVNTILAAASAKEASEQLDAMGLAPAREQIEWKVVIEETAPKPLESPDGDQPEPIEFAKSPSVGTPDRANSSGSAASMDGGSPPAHREPREPEEPVEEGASSEQEHGQARRDQNSQERNSSQTGGHIDRESQKQDRPSVSSDDESEDDSDTRRKPDILDRYGTPEALKNRHEPWEHPDKPHRRRGKLRSYVLDDDEPSNDERKPELAKRRRAVDEAGIRAVKKYEESKGYNPIEMAHQNVGYDIRSVHRTNGQTRFIEVKSLSGAWDDSHPAALSKAQYDYARKTLKNFWLYVVENAESDHPRIHRIQNPAGQVNQYLFDDGWRAVADNK